MCSSDSTFAKAGMPLNRIPFLMIQNNSRPVPVHAMTSGAAHARDLVAFYQARLSVRGTPWNGVSAGPLYEQVFGSTPPLTVEI